MTPPVVADSSTTAAERQLWTRRIGEVAALLGQPLPPAVEFLPGPLGVGAQYDPGTDTVRVSDGWIEAQPDPHSLASSSLLAHELGHREDVVRVRRARQMYFVAYVVLMTALVTAIVMTMLATEFGVTAAPVVRQWWFVPVSVLLFGGALIPAFIALRWPREFYADDVAARRFGADGVAACLAVYAAHNPRRRSWPSHTHPSHRMRLVRQRRRAGRR